MTTESASGGAVVVIGSAAALGGAILRRLVADQPQPCAWIGYRSDAQSAEALASSVAGTQAIRCDLRDPDDVARVAAEIGAAAGHVQALVHAAVEIRVGPVLEVGYETVSDVVRSSGLSLLALAAGFDDLLVGGSTITYITSIGSHRPIQGYAAIGAAKSVGDTLMRYLADDLAPRGIRVNSVSAGPFVSKAALDVVGDVEALMQATDAATPRGRRLDLEELADTVAFLASPAGSGITGQVVTVDAGIFSRWAL